MLNLVIGSAWLPYFSPSLNNLVALPLKFLDAQGMSPKIQSFQILNGLALSLSCDFKAVSGLFKLFKPQTWLILWFVVTMSLARYI